MESEVGAAKSAFPTQVDTIDRLAARDEVFADLCRDFELAVSEIRKWETSTAPERSVRLSEYTILIKELRDEVERALDSTHVIHLKIDGPGRY